MRLSVSSTMAPQLCHATLRVGDDPGWELAGITGMAGLVRMPWQVSQDAVGGFTGVLWQG